MSIEKYVEPERELERQMAYVSIYAHASKVEDTSALLSIFSEYLPTVMDVTMSSLALLIQLQKALRLSLLGLKVTL